MQEWETLYRDHHKAVYRYLCSLTHDAALAEDLLSETFIKAMKKQFDKLSMNEADNLFKRK